MVGSFVIMGIFASFVLAGLWGEDNSDDDDTVPPTDPGLMPEPEPEPQPEPEPEPAPQDDFLVGNGETLTGTSADDVFAFDPDASSFDGVNLAAGDGDDIVNLFVEPDPITGLEFVVINSTIDGGAGNDVMDVASYDSQITGGDGDDRIISYFGAESSVFGGAGDDTLTAVQEASGGVALFGGAGNDLLDGTEMENGALFGGDGDDSISVASANDLGAGFAIRTDGGEGDDTILYTGSALTDDLFRPNVLNGGAGADSFVLQLDEGAQELETTLGTGSAVQPDGSVRLAAVDIGDFTSGEDVLVVNAETQNETFTLTTARLETVEGANGAVETQLILRYESLEEPVRDVVVSFGTAAVTWDDITFVGDEIPAVIAV